MSLVRLNDFTPGTTIISGDVDAEFNQLVNLLNGTKDDNTLLKFTHATIPVLNINQLNTAVGSLALRIQQNTVDKMLVKSNGFIVGVPKCIHSDFTITGNVGAGLDVLRTVTVPSAVLLANGDWALCHLSGNFASNDADKRLSLTVDGTIFLETGLIDIDAFGWWIDIMMMRETSTSVRVNISQRAGDLAVTSPGVVSGSGSSNKAASGTEPVSDLGSNAFNIVISGEATSNNDVTITQSMLMVCQMG